MFFYERILKPLMKYVYLAWAEIWNMIFFGIFVYNFLSTCYYIMCVCDEFESVG